MTYKKIAELAGVSISTVSKALSGNHEISSETAEKIRTIAEANGVVRPKYRRDRSNLRIAVLVPEIISVYYSTIVTAVANELRRRTIEPLIYIVGFDDARFCRVFDQLVEDASADGIVLLTGDKFGAYPSIPTVQLTGEHSEQCDSVFCDGNAGINDAIQYLYSLGHTEIGFISERHTQSKLRSFRSTMTALRLSVNPDYIFVSDKRFELIGVEAAEHFIKQKKLPTALIAAYDEVAMGAISTFGCHGIRVPDDISVIGMNDIPSAKYNTPALTTIRTHSDQMVAVAIKQLLDHIDHPDTHKCTRIVLRGELIIRSSAAAPKSKPKTISKEK